MSTHNICFRGEIRKILCGYPLLSVAMLIHVCLIEIPVSYTNSVGPDQMQHSVTFDLCLHFFRVHNALIRNSFTWCRT